MNRLDKLNEYLRLAQLQPEENKLYIEDLKASIEMEECKPQPFTTTINSGFIDADKQS